MQKLGHQEIWEAVVQQMRATGVNHNFQPHRKHGIVWPYYTPCRKFEIHAPCDIALPRAIHGLGERR